MRTKVALYWTEGKRAIVPEGDKSMLFAEAGKEIARAVIQRFGLEAYCESGAPVLRKVRRPRENK